MIYISEAHAADVWPIGESASTINYKHKNIRDRGLYADKFAKTFDFNIPIFLDNMDNEFETETASWPFRYFLTNGTKFHFIPDPSDSTYDIMELFDMLESIIV